MIPLPPDCRFEPDPNTLVELPSTLPPDWSIDAPDPDDRFDIARLVTLLRNHERHGRGWPGASVDDVLVEIAEPGLRTRANVVLRDDQGEIRAWGSVHDRAGGRMLYAPVVDRLLDDGTAKACSDLLFEWAVGQARSVGAARGLKTQQIDTGAFADDDRQHDWLEEAGFERVRSWWQMNRPVGPDEVDLVSSPASWTENGVTVRLVRRSGTGMPEEDDLREVHEVLESAFLDHFNSREETFEEFIHRLRLDPGHRWDHWWLAEIDAAEIDETERPEAHDSGPVPVGALVVNMVENADGPNGSYVSYIGVLSAARGRGVAKGLLRTAIADAAERGRNGVSLEVDADSPTGAEGLYTSMGWKTSYVTESWHRDVPVEG